MSDMSDRTTVVVGASRGLGRGIARAFAEVLTPETAGSALLDLVQAEPAATAPGYLLTAAGLSKLP